MHNRFVAAIFWVLYLCTGVSAEDEIKKGTYPYMGFLYYQDESIVDGTGARFLQGAILIRPEFLISSTVVASVGDDPLSKTLLARLGAAHIDPKFTFNEDEDEQEQEVIQIITPAQHNESHWWASDISLLKTLQPFKETTAVHVTQLSTKRTFDKTCSILAFKKSEGGMFLTKYAVEMLPPSSQSCGEHFQESTMTCAADPPSISEEKGPQTFCRGISGGPLLCKTDVMALQTYINGDCKPPHLYQLLAPWKNFLTCGTEEQCDDKEKCHNICTVTLKDAPSTEKVRSTTSVSEAVTEESSPKEETASSEEASTTEEPAATEEAAAPSEELAKSASTFKASEEGPTGKNAANGTEKTEAELKEDKADIEFLRSGTANNRTDGNRTNGHGTDCRRASPPTANDIISSRHAELEDEDVEQTVISVVPIPTYNTNVANKNVIVIQSLIYSCFFMWICMG